MIGDAFHGGDNHHHVGRLRRGPDDLRRVQHALRAEQGSASELKCDYIAGTFGVGPHMKLTGKLLGGLIALGLAG